MGADIHAYVESYSKSDYTNTPGRCYVDYFSGELNFGRNYTLFGLIAGVRSMNGPIYPVRGIPTAPGLSFGCEYDLYVNVVEREEDLRNGCMFSCSRSILRTEAENWITSHHANYVNAEKTKISNPSYHSMTYLSLEELSNVRKQYLLEHIEYESELSRKNKKHLIDFIQQKTGKELIQFSFPGNECVSLYATLKIMQAIEDSSIDNDIVTRFVCWFDS